MFKKIVDLFRKEKFEVIALVKNKVEWKYASNGKPAEPDVITWFLEQGDRGTRKYSFHSHGTTAEKGVESDYEAPILLWQKTGILPENAEPMEFIAMKQGSK
jgi:hypothetical protein